MSTLAELRTYLARFREEEGYVELVPARRRVYRWREYEVEEVEQVEGESLFPYPAYRVPRDVIVHVVRRLESTRRGASADWAAGKQASTCLNQAPYNPVFRGWVEAFAWAPPCDAAAERDRLALRQPHFLESPLVHQAGTGVINWQGWVVDPPPVDPEELDRPARGHLRLWLRDVVASGRLGEADRRQGHLSVWVAQVWMDLPEDLPYGYSQVVFNHYLAGGHVIARYGEWFLCEVRGPILSPDHPPLVLDPRLYIMRHPVPVSRRGAD